MWLGLLRRSVLCFHPDSHWLNVLCSQTWTPATEEGCSIWLREEPANSSATLKTTWRTPWWTPPTRLWIKWPRKYGWLYPGCHQEHSHKPICCLYFPSSVNSMEHWMECGSTCYIGEVYLHFEAHIARTIGSDMEHAWMKAWVTLKRILHALISFVVNVVHSDRLLQPWMGFKTILQGGGQRGRRQSLARPLCVGAQASAPAAQRRFCITRNTRTHMHTQFLSHYWLSKFDCDDSSPVFFLPLAKSLLYSSFPPSQLSLLSCGWIIHGPL